LLARIFTRPGQPYNEEGLRSDFQALWNTQCFEGIRLRAEESSTGLTGIEAKERPLTRRIR
jgi:hypothetical protein